MRTMMKNHRVNTLLKTIILASLSILASAQAQSNEHTSLKADNKQSRPNIVWLITEDNSKHYLKLYDKNGAAMPTVERLAENGLVFDNAFSNSPVCSTARTTLATGLYGSSIGTMNHRSYRKVTLPNDVEPFSQILKKAGYYTTNNAKTDYNFIDSQEFWDDSSRKANWRNRENGQPFFHVQTFGITHEGKLHFKKGAITNQATIHDPKTIKLAPIYPDTPTFRYTHAKTLDNHQQADKQMGKVIAQLKKEGVLENTFIFYFGDHGGVLPASKGYLFETGLSVPLVVRVPKNFKHLVGKGLDVAKTRVWGMVSFIDFAPTVLELAGLPKPKEYPGHSFLSAQTSLADLNQRDEIYGQADRFDEKSDLVRSVRKGNFKYIRHYQPYYPDGLHNYYRYKQLAFQEWRNLFKQGKLTPQQAAFFEPNTPEALFDISKDPYEMNNLAEQTKFHSTLVELRTLLRTHQSQLPDLGFIAESKLVQTNIKGSFYEYGQSQNAHIQQLIDIANLQLNPFNEVREKLKSAISHKQEDIVYRGLISLTSFGSQGLEFAPSVKNLLAKSTSVRVKGRALEFLTLVDNFDPTTEFNQIYAQAAHDLEQVELLNIATLLKEQKGFVFAKPETLTFSKPKSGTLAFMVNVWLKNQWSYVSTKY